MIGGTTFDGAAWVNMKDRQPEKSGDYLVCIRPYLGLPFLQVCSFEPPPDAMLSGFDTARVTHWMPLPEVPA